MGHHLANARSRVGATTTYPGRYIGPLEDWCRFVAFTDKRADAQLCVGAGNGMSCSQPTATSLAPWFMPETSGDPWSWASGAPTKPVALVLGDRHAIDGSGG